MQVLGYAMGTYVSRTTKENSFRSPTYQSLYRLVSSTMCHRYECDNIPSSDLFYMWCLTQTDIRLNIPFALAFNLSGMDLGTFPSSMICSGH